MITSFERKGIDEAKLYGQVIARSDTLVLLHHEYDFEFDGFEVIRQRDITMERITDSNRYCAVLMKKEGLWKRAPAYARRLPVGDWHSLLTALIGRTVITENERAGDFTIGPLLGCTKRLATIRYFDGCGQWQAVEQVKLSSLTSVKFGDRYSTIMTRHLPPLPPA